MKADYKQTEIGSIPHDWQAVRLGKHATFKTGPFGSALHKSDYIEEGVPVINPMQIKGNRIVPTSSMTIDGQVAKKLSEFRLSAGNIIIGRRGEMGRCALVTKAHQGWLCGTGSMVIRTLPSVDPHFIQLILSSGPAIAAIENASVGSTMINLNQQTLSKLLIPYPPTRLEQEAIAEAISDAETWIESLETLLHKKRLINQGAMQELLRPNQGWNSILIDEAFHFLKTSSYSRAELNQSAFAGYIHYGDIHTKWSMQLDLRKELLPTISSTMLKSFSLVQSGDIVMADASEDYSGVGKSVEVSNVENQRVIAGLHTLLLRQKSKLFAPKFAGYLIHSSFVKTQLDTLATGLKVYSISKAVLKLVQMQYPTFEEQTRIVTILSDMDAEIEALEQKLTKAQQIKLGMMQQLLTGQIRLIKSDSAQSQTQKRATA